MCGVAAVLFGALAAVVVMGTLSAGVGAKDAGFALDPQIARDGETSTHTADEQLHGGLEGVHAFGPGPQVVLDLDDAGVLAHG